jgi:multicomponent Na+:H+ antiporter subunit F
MSEAGSGTILGLANVVLLLLGVALVFAFLRLARGPSLPDRVVALELITAVAVGMISVYAVASGQPVFLDAAIALALVSFLGTVAFARYVEKGGRPWRGS